jgi:hypothetical protein
VLTGHPTRPSHVGYSRWSVEQDQLEHPAHGSRRAQLGVQSVRLLPQRVKQQSGFIQEACLRHDKTIVKMMDFCQEADRAVVL